MKLHRYPQAIADAERQLLKANQALRASQAELDQLTAALESQIAHDETLKNDAQRKAKRAELMADGLYQECLKELHYTQDNRTACEIELSLLRNQWAVAKLETRERIAQMERATA
jgi:hypothetical protein